MRKLAYVILIGLFAVVFTACSLLGGKLQPGDKIGEMQILDFCEGQILYELCNDDQFNQGTCEIPAAVTSLWISPGWTESTQEEIETAWKTSEWKVSLDGREIDLPAFGTYDFDKFDPDLNKTRKARTWNVCLTNLTAGKHDMNVHFYLEDSIERGNHDYVLTFNVLAP